MNSRRQWLIAGGAGAVALAAGARIAWREWERAPIDAFAVDDFFSRSYPDADGVPQLMSQWRGQLLVVNFWATWCAPCVEEMPDLERIAAEYASRGVTIVGLAIDKAEAVRDFRDELQLHIPLVVAGSDGSQVASRLGNRIGAIPYTVLVDANSTIVQSHLGRVPADELRRWLNKQLT